jgi:hypothetical protein
MKEAERGRTKHILIRFFWLSLSTAYMKKISEILMSGRYDRATAIPKI